MDVFLVKRTIHSSILCVLFHSVVVTCCHLDPDIFITSLDLEGLSGSCLLIPCNFRVKKGKQFPGNRNAAAVWIKNKSQFKDNRENVIFNASRTSGNYPMKITGLVSQKECTTVFDDLTSEYTETYFFRVEDEKFKSTASCSPINIIVRDSPWSPSIEVAGVQTETEVVTITCSAVTPCPTAPPELTWDLHQGTANTAGTNGTFTTKITQTITLTSAHDGYNLTCSAAYPVNEGKDVKRAQTTITLNVTRSDSGDAAVTSDVTKWLPAIIVFIALIGVLVLIWHFKFRHAQLQPPRVQTVEEVVHQEPAETEDSLCYEDVRFSPVKPKPVVSSAQEETVYSQVKVSNKNIRQNTEMNDLYAQVNKT